MVGEESGMLGNPTIHSGGRAGGHPKLPILKLPSVLLRGQGCLRATWGRGQGRQVRGGSNNIGLGVQYRMGSLERHIPGKHFNSADGSPHLPLQAFGQGTGGRDPGLRRVWCVPSTCRCPPPTSRLCLQCAPSSLPSLTPLPAPSPAILEHKAASVQSIGAHNPG